MVIPPTRRTAWRRATSSISRYPRLTWSSQGRSRSRWTSSTRTTTSRSSTSRRAWSSTRRRDTTPEHWSMRSSAGVEHRLDKGTSGLIVVARNDRSHRALSSQLSDRTLSRAYLAIVRGLVRDEAGELEGPIGRHPRERKRMAVVAGGRFARTRYQVVDRKPTHTLLRCDLDTGRTHQIRVHLATLGYPVAGDGEYGGSEPGAGRPMLHAWRRQRRHPRAGLEMTFEAPPPADGSACCSPLP